MDELAALPIRRNTILLAASMACLSGMFQLVAAVSSLTFVKVTGVHGLLGLGPAIFLVTAAFAAYQAGRGMDRFGRIPVLAVGFAVATLGLVVTGVGTRIVEAPLVIAGFVLLGAALGTLTLVRTAGGDMYPPEKRAAGIALVLSGAVVGAFLGPVVFDPLLAGRQLSTDSLSIAWLAAVGSRSPVSRSCSACGRTRVGSPSCWLRADGPMPSRGRPPRSARSSGAPVSLPRCSVRSRATP